MRPLKIAAAIVAAVALPQCALADTLTLTGVVRDFTPSHPDFEHACCGMDYDIVTATLGADGRPVYAPGSAGSTWSTYGQDAFNQWFRDVPGVNLSASKSIVLDNGIAGPGGTYTYHSGSFFPIDGELFGDYAYGHNYHFTYQIHGTFGYKPGAGQVFDFAGDDDVWVYFDKKLAINLGGVHGETGASVNLDTFFAGLGGRAEGNYDFDFFFAERHTTGSNLKIETSLTIVAVPEPETYAMLLAGLGVLAARRRRAA
ncbi:MAG TPA: fibro-slime domain-containing protein [Rhodocyclaceae bacterium]|nr:fibro-slime domain-containing protein [Rhodocyclaceae bacterium]